MVGDAMRPATRRAVVLGSLVGTAILAACSPSSPVGGGGASAAQGSGGALGHELDGGSDGDASGGWGPTDAPADVVAPTACTFTVSGAVTASGTCMVYVAYNPSSADLGIAITGSSGYFTFGAQLGTSGSFAPGTWTYADEMGIAGADYVQIPDSWDMSKGNTSTMAPQGDFTLKITDTGPEITIDGGAIWLAAHGSVSVSMPATPGGQATGVVIGHITF
jgi:hypothetical protein